jgi:hypothetical protein
MIRILLLSILFAESVAAQGALDEGQQHPWTQAIDECMAAGGQRSDCYESMPADIRDQMESWEAERGVVGRRQFESRPEVDNTASKEINVGDGILKVRSFSVPIDVDEDRLRNLTNVDRSTPLTLQEWGDFSGYQYDYAERGSFFRQWWLVNQRTMMFIVYESRVELDDAVSDEIDRIVNSMTVNES